MPKRDSYDGEKKLYAVFGLGRYGLAVAKELEANGAEVLAVDMDEDLVNAASPELAYCQCADVTDAEALRQLGIDHMDVVIIAMANSLESSVLSTLLCKDLGVPMVIAKCACETHYKILAKVGADKVVLPEVESGIRLAKNLLRSGYVDILELSPDVSIVEMEVQEAWEGQNLAALELRRKHSINVLAIVRDGEIQAHIDPEAPLQRDMRLIVLAHMSKLKNI